MGAALRSMYEKNRYEEVCEEWEKEKNRYEEVCEEWEKAYGPQTFSYKTLYKAAKGFKDGGFHGTEANSKIYKGKLSSGAQIAVRRVSLDAEDMKLFVAQTVSIGRLRHKNLVQLIGYCRRKGELLLVYDHMPNGNLHDLLFSFNNSHLDWSNRFHIIKGVASALQYLHEGCETVVLHRDVKASNVLVDAELNGHLDFGLVRFGTNNCNVVGSVGYMAPELIITGMPTTKTDVYAFGVMLLEVACGRRIVESPGKPEEFNLVRWVSQWWKKGALVNARDRKLDRDYTSKELELVLKLGLVCSQYNPEDRPGMLQVLRYLEFEDDLPDMPPDTPGIEIPTPYNEVLVSPV